ncbi:hypothetical protein TNCV_795921 [Trichonephila clavipes]|nr:hypothetical protein TNCV_795921 [Trichonephila clavipes]
MDLLKFKLEIAEAHASTAFKPTNQTILTDDDDNVVTPPEIRSKYYNLPAKRPCQDKKHGMYSHFRSVDDISRPRK